MQQVQQILVTLSSGLILGGRLRQAYEAGPPAGAGRRIGSRWSSHWSVCDRSWRAAGHWRTRARWDWCCSQA